MNSSVQIEDLCLRMWEAALDRQLDHLKKTAGRPWGGRSVLEFYPTINGCCPLHIEAEVCVGSSSSEASTGNTVQVSIEKLEGSDRVKQAALGILRDKGILMVS